MSSLEAKAALNNEPLNRGVNPKLLDIVNPYMSKYGLNITDGYRDPATAGPNSAKNSQHYSGNAVDMNWSHLSNDQRLELATALRNDGIGGIGFGNSILHADLGNTRHWTYDNQGKWISGLPAYAQGLGW